MIWSIAVVLSRTAATFWEVGYACGMVLLLGADAVL